MFGGPMQDSQWWGYQEVLMLLPIYTGIDGSGFLIRFIAHSDLQKFPLLDPFIIRNWHLWETCMATSH